MSIKKIVVSLTVVFIVLAALTYPSYLLAQHLFEGYFERWGERLVALEQRGLLSTQFGAAWQDILTDEAMASQASHITGTAAASDSQHEVEIIDGVRLRDYPSLSLVARLNQISVYSNTISITDRNNEPIAVIRTDHTRAKLPEFPSPLIGALIAAEDKNYFDKNNGFEFRSYVRALLYAVVQSIRQGRKVSPKGTSTITQQVAKLFISDIDESGRRQVQRSVDRKLREMRIAAALRKTYTPEQILEVYLNHCVTSDFGLIGYNDIVQGLFDKPLSQLSDAEAVYLSRMVKWGRNYPEKIIAQCHIDMPRIAEALQWDRTKQQQVLTALDTIHFTQPRRIVTSHGQLIDCANEAWQQVLLKNGYPQENLDEMNLIEPNSLVRKKGNLTIQLTIDLRLQRTLEELVKQRGYGKDTVILTDARIGSSGSDVVVDKPPTDTLRHTTIIREPQRFSEPDAAVFSMLQPGDTLVTNVRYRSLGSRRYRRSCFYYTRKPISVDGQYFAYSIMDSRSGELLAYYAREKIGSRMASLLQHRTPNGSSTAKPLFNALAFDLGIFQPTDKWSDTVTIGDSLPWQRTFDMARNRRVGVQFQKSAVRGTPYKVHNHGDIFEGTQYIFDHLASSNNILGAESCYRLDGKLFGPGDDIAPQAFPLVQFFYRIGAFERIKNQLRLPEVTGVRVYKELARIVGVDIDSMQAFGRKIAISDSLYSVSLGTLELTLLEQMHLFNALYENSIIENPATHPSLFVKSITLNNTPVVINDTIMRYHPFADVNNLRPTYLGMHKRLTSNGADGLADFDIPFSPDPSQPCIDSAFNPHCFLLQQTPSNYAKSGTTDDVIRPFNVDVISDKRTNYGLWNAVIRLDMARLGPGSEPSEIRDITLSCIGECNTRYTGERDGKSLHKFLSRALLQNAGIRAPQGYFTNYERYLSSCASRCMNCPQGEAWPTER